MTAIGTVPSRGNRHPISAVMEARRLSAAGWGDAEIARTLLQDGFVRSPVARATIGRWVRASREQSWRADAQANAASRAAQRGARGIGRWSARPEFKMARVRALHGEGLSVNAIATVMRFDFGDRLTEHQVRYALRMGRYPRVGD